MKQDKEFLRSLLLSIVREDDEKSFEKLFVLFYRRLVSFSNHYVHSYEVAEEAVSEVFVKVWNNRKSLHKVQNIETYLFTAVKNQSLNYRSRVELSSINVSAGKMPDLSDVIDVFDPEQALELQELQYTINLAIESLSPQCKAIFKMIREDGLRYKEVADILNISWRTVETQFMRALKKLDAILSPYLDRKLRSSAPSSGGHDAEKYKNFLLSLIL